MRIHRNMDLAQLRQLADAHGVATDADLRVLRAILSHPRQPAADTSAIAGEAWLRLIDLAWSPTIEAAAAGHVSALAGEAEAAAPTDAETWERGDLPYTPGWDPARDADDALIRAALAARIGEALEALNVLAEAGFAIGDAIVAGTGPDREAGRIVGMRSAELAMVAWSQGTAGPCPVADLEHA